MDLKRVGLNNSLAGLKNYVFAQWKQAFCSNSTFYGNKRHL